MTSIKIATACVTLVLTDLAAPARAGTITNTYTGNLFTNFSGADSCDSRLQRGECAITGSFTVDTTSLQMTSYEFSDGVFVWTNLNSMSSSTPDCPACIFEYSNPGSDNITSWEIVLKAVSPSGQWVLQTNSDISNPFQNLIAEDETSFISGSESASALNVARAGTWTVAGTSAPEPATFGLFASALAGILLLRSQKARFWGALPPDRQRPEQHKSKMTRRIGLP